VFSSDRGEVLGEHGLFGCRSFAGSGTYVPVWVVPPAGVGDTSKANDQVVRDNDLLISGVDLAPTLCAIGGVDTPPGCTGQSLLPGLFGQSVGRYAAISEFGNRILIETLHFKAMFDTETAQPRVIFDMSDDDGEVENLAGTPFGNNVVDSLRHKLADQLLPLRPVTDGSL
jgi:hypothetical protein